VKDIAKDTDKNISFFDKVSLTFSIIFALGLNSRLHHSHYSKHLP
jgi:hypothetical protein